jgi:hypothetical protein
MNIEHFGFLSWFPEKCGRLKRKDHAQDCGTLMRHQRPAILRMVFAFRMASILPMVRASYPLSPSGRIAAGHAAQASYAYA